MPADHSALLVIDMLNDNFDRHAALAERRPRLTTAINALTRAFRTHGQVVIWVGQEFLPDLSDAPLEVRRHGIRVTIADTKGCELLTELERPPADVVVIKKRYSAFFRTQPDDVLNARRITSLVVAGVNAHACIRTTVIDAYQRDYDVVVASDGVASHDHAHDAITVQYLDGKMAAFRTTEDVVATLR